MAIKFYPDRIEFNQYTLKVDSNGLHFDGELQALMFENKTQAQGTVYGFASAGYVSNTTIDRFAFASNNDALDVGDLPLGRGYVAGQSSSTNGYVSGDNAASGGSGGIDKFPFSISGGTGTDVGDLSQGRWHVSGQSSTTHGYTSGGATLNTIDKFPFSTDSNASDVGNLSIARALPAGQSSSTDGYVSGGYTNNPLVGSMSIVDKFPFATDSNASATITLTQARNFMAGQSSSTHGYTSGGLFSTPAGTRYNTIDKFSFFSDADASDVGDLLVARSGQSGQSSTTDGYISGGQPTDNTIQKFPFAVDANTTDVSNLTRFIIGSAGQQV